MDIDSDIGYVRALFVWLVTFDIPSLPLYNEEEGNIPKTPTTPLHWLLRLKSNNMVKDYYHFFQELCK